MHTTTRGGAPHRMQSPLAVWTLTCPRCRVCRFGAACVVCRECPGAALGLATSTGCVHRPHHSTLHTHEYGTFPPRERRVRATELYLLIPYLPPTTILADSARVGLGFLEAAASVVQTSANKR